MSMLIAFDMDGTLCFLEDLHKVSIAEKLSKTLVNASFPSLTEPVLAFCYESKGSPAYMAISTHLLLHELSLKKNVKIAIVTAARPSTIWKRYFGLSAAHYFIIENGGAIYDARSLSKDRRWDKYLQPQRDLLADTKARLQAQGWVLDSEGRTSAIRIRQDDNPNKTSDEFQDMALNFQLSDGLSKTSNLGHLDIICGSAGKEKALAYLARQLNEPEVYAVGDDINDLPMLRNATKSFVVGKQFPTVVSEGQKLGWHFGLPSDVAAIDSILENLISNLE